MEKFGFGKDVFVGSIEVFFKMVLVRISIIQSCSAIRKILIKSEQNRYFLDGIIFKTTFLHDENIFFIRTFLKQQELDHSFPTPPTRASGCLRVKWYPKQVIGTRMPRYNK